MTEQEHKHASEALLERLNRQHGVLESPEGFKGWHLFWSHNYKPGVIHGQISRWINGGYEMKFFFCSVDVLRVARELGYIAKSNNLSLP